MMLVADSGSTKTDWRIVDAQGAIRQLRTSGYNPYILNQSEIIALLDAEIDSSIAREDVTTLFFYGSGCSGEKSNAIVQVALRHIFTNAIVEVSHDMLGAARSLCGREPGIASILGTGSNSCLYDGEHIIDNIPSLGYIAGDEGSGGHLGRLMLQAFYYRDMPTHIHDEFKKIVGNSREEVLDSIYRKSFPNKYLASLSELLAHHAKDAFSIGIVSKAFNSFVQGQLMKYKDSRNLKMHFTGSIAFHYAPILQSVLKDNGCMPGHITPDPIAGILLYHQPMR